MILHGSLVEMVTEAVIARGLLSAFARNAIGILVLAFAFTTVNPVVAGQLPQGDAINGERVFWPCRTCHYPEKVIGHNNGPSLWNIFGQQAGRQPGFEYSESFRKVDFRWTPALMDLWLQDPGKFVPGNQMMSLGVGNAQDRADLIEYLKTFSE